MTIKCPRCNSQNIAEIVYGLPDSSNKEFMTAVKAGKYELGGCVISDDNPTHKCNDCSRRWQSDTYDK